MKKAVVDTNALIGFLVQRDVFLVKGLEKFDEIVLSAEVFVETIYVLESNYGADREAIFDGLGRLLANEKFKYERVLFLNTLLRYRNNAGLDIVDCIVIERARSLGCDVLTGDKGIKRAI